MQWKKNWYRIHRWLALLVSVQLLAWSTGGFMFSILDIDNVHGDFEKSDFSPPAVHWDTIKLTPSEAVTAAKELKYVTISSIRLRERFGRTVYEFFNEKKKPIGAVDAVTGEVMPEITEDEVRRAAIADFQPVADITSVTYLQGDPPQEYKGNPMPVYRVIFDHPKRTHLYISPVTGEVIKRRNRPWRLFDFFWMLHIMDYRDRKDFNHPLLTTMSLIAVSTSLTGMVLWWYRIPRRKRRVLVP